MRGLGYLVDPYDARDYRADDAVSARIVGATPAEADWTHLALNVFDQGSLSSCAANAVAQALRASLVRNGAKKPRVPSRLQLYYLSRLYHGAADFDGGTYIRTVFQAAEHFGFCPEEFWPYESARVNKRPDKQSLRAALDQSSPTRYMRIWQEGPSRVDAVKRAIAAGYFVVFGTDVSVSFVNGVSSLPIDPPGPNDVIAGGHAMVWAGYKGDDFRVINSWGTSWGQDGECWMTADYVMSSRTRDLWIVEAAPNFSG